MGAVFSALDTATGQQVALKRLSPDAPAAARVLFEREFCVLLSLRHPRIIEVYEYGLDEAGPFYTMELLEGSDLRELAPLPALSTCRLMRDVASSLALLHARRLLHRDVSPRNVRMRGDGSCKLLDFGALMSFGTSDQIVGTPPAIPPEALSGQALDQRTDLYSLGALGYYLLTGRQAYPARSVQTLPDVWAAQVVPPSFFAKDVPKELEALILQLLSLDVLARPNSASEVIDRLNAVASLEPDHDGQIARAYFRGAQLVEREREIARAERAIARAKEGHGRTWVLEARAGVGKTRMLDEIALRAQIAGLVVLRADAARHAGRLETVRALLAQLVRLHPQLCARVLDAQLSQLAAVWPELTGPSATEAAAPPPGAITEEAWQRLTSVIEARLFALSQVQPLLLAVDNVPQCDNHSAGLLMALSRRARGAPLLMITSARLPRLEQTPALRGLYSAATAITLHGLSSQGTQLLLRSAFGDIPNAQRTASRLHQATHGNPKHTLMLLERWVSDGLVQYTGGSFNLPLSIPPAALLTQDQVDSERFATCSPNAIEISCSLAQLQEPVAFATCVAIQAAQRDSRSMYDAIDELLRAEVLVQTAQGLCFHNKRLRMLANAALPAEMRVALHARIAQHLLETSDGSFEKQAQAGLQLVRAGEGLRGAQLIAAAARRAVVDDVSAVRLAKQSPALDAALEAYREQGRSQLEQLDLLVPLVLSSYEISLAFALRHGDAAISSLEQALGLSKLRKQAEPVTLEALLGALSTAPNLQPGQERNASTPDVATLIGWLLRSVATLVAVAGAAIDHEAEARYIEALRPFQLLGPEHPAALVFEFCSLLIALTEDRFAQAHRGWSEMLVRLQRVDTLPPSVIENFIGTATFALGLLESQLDDDRGLARIAELEQMDRPRAKLSAAQLSFLYYGFRGDMEKSDACRERLEAHAVQHGSAWQMEVWSSCTSTAMYANTRDVSGTKRTLVQLDRLRRQMPSLEQYWERAAATQHQLAGAPARAVEVYEKTLARPGARERVGWAAVRAGLAAAYNDLGQHARAREILEGTLRLCVDDLEYVALFLRLQTELCRSLSGLGEHESAQRELDRLFDRCQPNNNPLTLGILHGTAAELALKRPDIIAFEHHLNMMHSYYAPTRNPALSSQGDRLRNMHASLLAGRSPLALTTMTGTGLLNATGHTTLLTTVHGTVERKQRALELVATQSDAREAYLFSRGFYDEPVLLSTLGGTAPALRLLEAVRQMFEVIPEDSDETAMASHAITTTAEPILDFRLLPLIVVLDAKRKLIGAIAVSGGHHYRPVSHALLGELGMQLYRAGDMVSARTLG
jgi:tetratricopeptide (TPR) repeat protein